MIGALMCWLGFHRLKYHRAGVIQPDGTKFVGWWDCNRDCGYVQRIVVPQ